MMATLLSVNESAEAQPLRCWDRAKQEQLAAIVGETALQWHRDWELAEPRWALEEVPEQVPEQTPEQKVCVESLLDSTPQQRALVDWQPVEAPTSGCWWAISPSESVEDPASVTSNALPSAAQAQLYCSLFCEVLTATQLPSASSVIPATLAADLLQQSWRDWQDRLNCLGARPSELGKLSTDPISLVQALDPWSGSLVLSLPWCGKKMLLLLAYDRVACLLGPATGPTSKPMHSLTPVTSIGRAMAKKTTSLKVELVPITAELGSIADLRIGDVLCTSHPLDAPLVVKAGSANAATATNAVLCAGFLGRIGGRKAIELLGNAE